MKGKFMFTAGLVGGTLVGIAVGAAIDPIKDKHNARFKRNTTRAFRTIGNLIDGIIDMHG